MAGTAFYLMAFVDGRILWDPALPELERQDRRPIHDAMNRASRGLTAIDIAAAGLSDMASPAAISPANTSAGPISTAPSETARIEDMERLIAWLAEQSLPDDGRRRAVTATGAIDNMIFDAKSPRLLASSTGNCRRSATPSPTLPITASNGAGLRQANIVASEGSTARRRNPDRGRIRRGLLPADGACAPIPASGPFPIAFSFFRIVAIAQGVYKRSLDGNASIPSLPGIRRIRAHDGAFAWEGVETES